MEKIRRDDLNWGRVLEPPGKAGPAGGRGNADYQIDSVDERELRLWKWEAFYRGMIVFLAVAISLTSLAVLGEYIRFAPAMPIQSDPTFDLEHWKLFMDRFMTRLGASVQGNAGVVFAMLGVLANWVALDSVRDGERKALAHGKSEGLMRIYAQGAQLTGAVAATVETALGKLPAFASSIGRGVQSVAGRLLGILGKVLGVGGSLFMAGIDGFRAVQENKEGNLVGTAGFWCLCCPWRRRVLAAVPWYDWLGSHRRRLDDPLGLRHDLAG